MRFDLLAHMAAAFHAHMGALTQMVPAKIAKDLCHDEVIPRYQGFQAKSFESSPDSPPAEA